MSDQKPQTITPSGQVPKDPTTHELLEKFLEQQKCLIEKFDGVLEKSDHDKKKDKWDVLSSLSGLFTFFSSIVIALVGIYFTNAYKSQEVRITEAQTVEKFLPFLNSQSVETRKGALLAAYGLQNYELATRLAASYAAPDNIEACEVILKTAKDDAREQLIDALVDALKTRAENELNDNYSKMDREELIRNYDRIFQLRDDVSIREKRGSWYLASIYTGRGNAYRALKKFEQASADFKKALGFFPDSAWTFESMGLMESTQDNFDRAIENINKAIEKQPNFGQYYADLGDIYAKKANREKDDNTKKKYLDNAETQFIKAVEKDPSDIWLHSSLALFYFNNQMPDKAGEAFEAIYNLSDNEGNRTLALYYLNKIYPHYSRPRIEETENTDSPSIPEAPEAAPNPKAAPKSRNGSNVSSKKPVKLRSPRGQRYRN